MTEHTRPDLTEPDPTKVDLTQPDPTKVDLTQPDRAYADPRITAVGLLAETFGGLGSRFAPQFAEHDVSGVEFEVLLRLARTPGNALRMTDLAAQTQLTTSGVTRVVDRLERDGLVQRRACPTDRRGSFAHLTRAGRDRLDRVLPGHLALIERWFTGLLSPQQLATLLDLLRVIRDTVRPDATAGVAGTSASARESRKRREVFLVRAQGTPT